MGRTLMPAHPTQHGYIVAFTISAGVCPIDAGTALLIPRHSLAVLDPADQAERDLGGWRSSRWPRFGGRAMTKSDGTRASPRPLRRDAALNLERIVVAAQYAFAKSGFEASMEEIAAPGRRRGGNDIPPVS